jgi:hypothetical protein
LAIGDLRFEIVDLRLRIGDWRFGRGLRRFQNTQGDDGWVGLGEVVVAQENVAAQVGEQGGHGGGVQVSQGGEMGWGKVGEGENVHFTLEE